MKHKHKFRREREKNAIKQKPKVILERLPIYDMVLFPGIKKEDPVKSAQSVKYLYSALSVIGIIVFMFISFRTAINIMETKLNAAQQQINELKPVVEEVKKATEEIQKTRKRIEAEEAHKLAIKYTASARAFEIPVSFVMACAKIETEYNPDCIGPFNEREDFQIYKPSFAAFFPASEWNNRQKRYIAGLTHYAICVKIAQKHAIDTRTQILLSLALHNSGYAHRNINNAFKVAWKHVKRAEQMRIWEIADGGSSA